MNVPTIRVLDIASAGSGLARGAFEVTHTTASKANKTGILQKLTGMWKGAAVPVAGSFKTIDKHGNYERVTGLIKANRISKPLEVAQSEGFKSVSANMYMDNEAELWQLHKTAAGSIVVKASGVGDDEELLALLSQSCSMLSVSSQIVEFKKENQAHGSHVAGGDYIVFGEATGAINNGFVVAAGDNSDLIVLDAQNVDRVIHRGAVIGSMSSAKLEVDYKPSEQELMEMAIASARGQVDIPKLLDYYRKVFSYSPSYFEKIAQIITNHKYAC